MNLSPTEILVVMVVALLVLGPTRLPEAARQVGRGMRTLRQVSTGFQDEIRHAMEDADEADAARRAGIEPGRKEPYVPPTRPGPLDATAPQPAAPESIAPEPSEVEDAPPDDPEARPDR